MTDEKIIYRAEPCDPAYIYFESWCIEVCDYCPHKWKAKVGDTMQGAARIIRIVGLEIPAPRKPPMITGQRNRTSGNIVDVKLTKGEEIL